MLVLRGRINMSATHARCCLRWSLQAELPLPRSGIESLGSFLSRCLLSRSVAVRSSGFPNFLRDWFSALLIVNTFFATLALVANSVHAGHPSVQPCFGSFFSKSSLWIDGLDNRTHSLADFVSRDILLCLVGRFSSQSPWQSMAMCQVFSISTQGFQLSHHAGSAHHALRRQAQSCSTRSAADVVVFSAPAPTATQIPDPQTRRDTANQATFSRYLMALRTCQCVVYSSMYVDMLFEVILHFFVCRQCGHDMMSAFLFAQRYCNAF